MAPPPWAYQLENYITEPDEELVCSICRSVFCDPALCPCDHVFCKDCITNWLQDNRTCPICRKLVYNTSIKQTVPIVKNLIMKLMLNCHNKSLGCKSQFSVESSEAHVKECEYEFVHCKNIPCKDKLFRKDIVEHETKDCPHRYIQCEKCKCKIPSTKLMEKHSCIKALHNLVKEKKEIIQKQKDRIKELEKEIVTLKATLQDTDRRISRSHSSTLSSISPDDILINIHEYDSQTSVSSDSDNSSDNIYFFSNEPLPNRNEELDVFSAYMNREDNPQREANPVEYRNAITQTDLLSTWRRPEFHANNSFTEIAPPSQNRKPVKRRPTTEKPAKRRLCPVTPSTSDDDDDDAHLPPKSSLKHWCLVTPPDQREDVDSYMEAGPSSAPTQVSSGATVSDNPKSTNSSRTKAKQKQVRQAGNNSKDNAVSSRVAVTSRNPVFERTLALLEQYNLESDPEWLPEYASHRGDTTTESDSSDLVDSSNSELSDVDSHENKSSILDDSQPEIPAMSDLMNWMFDSTSEDDPDWKPKFAYHSYKED